MRKAMLSGALAAIAVALLSSCATTEKSLQQHGATPLTHSELEALMSRTRTENFTTATGLSGTATFARNGTVKVDWGTGDAQGTWRIVGNRFCTKYQTLRGGNETCVSQYKTSKNEYKLFFPDGSLDATVVLTN